MSNEAKSTEPNAKSRKAEIGIIGLTVAVLALVVTYLAFPSTPTEDEISAGVRAAFGEGISLSDAIERSSQSGTPLVAVVGAEWCGACDRLKARTLADDRVASLLSDRAIAVNLEEESAAGEIAGLGVRYYPTTIVMRADEEVGRIEGFRDPNEFIGEIEPLLDAAAETETAAR